jgi:hypothetical protein
MSDDFHAGDGDRRRDHRERREVDLFRDRTPKGQSWQTFAPGDELRCPATAAHGFRNGTVIVCGARLGTVAVVPLLVAVVGWGYRASQDAERQGVSHTLPGTFERGQCPKCRAHYLKRAGAAQAPAAAPAAQPKHAA